MSNHTKTAAAYTQRAQLLRQIAQGPSEKMAEALLVLAEEFEHMAGVLAAKSSEVPAQTRQQARGLAAVLGDERTHLDGRPDNEGNVCTFRSMGWQWSFLVGI